MENANILIFAPHPDDDIIGCGGLITLSRNNGVVVDIVFLTRGENALRPYGLNGNIVSEKRSRQAMMALHCLGVTSNGILWMDVEDEKVDAYDLDILSKTIQIIKRKKYDAIFCPHPHDGHPDHAATSIIIKNAISEQVGSSPETGVANNIEENRLSDIIPMQYYFTWFWHYGSRQDMRYLMENGKVLYLDSVKKNKALALGLHFDEISPCGLPWNASISKSIQTFAYSNIEIYLNGW